MRHYAKDTLCLDQVVAAGEGAMVHAGATTGGRSGGRGTEAASCRTGSAVCTTFVLHQFLTKQTTF